MMSKILLSLVAGLVAASAIGCSGEPGTDGVNATEGYQQATPADGTKSAVQAAPPETASPESTGTTQDPLIFPGAGFGAGFVGPGFIGPGAGFGAGFVGPGFIGPGAGFIGPGAGFIAPGFGFGGFGTTTGFSRSFSTGW